MEGDFRIGEWVVSPRLNSVQSNGRAIRIENKMMRVLACLAKRPGEVVSKEELIRAAWEGTFVTDDVLTRAISELRRILVDDAKQPRIIETVARSGYRLIAPVKWEVPGKTAGSKPKRQLIVVLATAAVAGLALLSSLTYRSSRSRPAAGWVRSIAVLPLRNLTNDRDQEYFADGMTEALITDLSKIGALRVISRTTVMQYKASRKSLPEIARELKVDAVLEGSVQRSGDKVRITTELIDGKSDAHLWEHSFDRDMNDVLGLEADVAQAVAGEIRVHLSRADVARRQVAHPVSGKANDAYLHGLYLASSKNKQGLEQSIGFYQKAVDLDPQYALAYAAMADSYIVLEDDGHMPATEANPKIRDAARNAVAADPTLAEAHLMMADVKETEWDWAGAEREYRRAIELNPGLARAHHWYALLLSALHRRDEAISEIERAIDLDPLASHLYLVQAEVYYMAGRYDQALATLNSSPLLEGPERDAGLLAGMVYLEKGNYPEAMFRIRAAVDSSPENVGNLAALAYAYAAEGKREDAIRTLNELAERSKGTYIEPGWLAMVWVALGNKDRAMELLERDYHLHSSFLMFVGSYPAFAPLSVDPPFRNLMHRVGLPLG